MTPADRIHCSCASCAPSKTASASVPPYAARRSRAGIATPTQPVRSAQSFQLLGKVHFAPSTDDEERGRLQQVVNLVPKFFGSVVLHLLRKASFPDRIWRK